MGNVTFNVINNRLKRGSAFKATSIEISFYCDGKRKYLSTGIMIHPSEWADQKKEVIKRKDAKQLNELLQAWKDKAMRVVKKALDDGITDLDQLVMMMRNEDASHVSFIEYCEKRRDERKVGEHTKKRYDVFIKFLKEWGKIVSFSDCNVSRIRSMDEYLTKQGKAQCTIYDYHKYLKLFINDAIVDGLMEQNPYKMLSFRIGRGEKQYVDCINEEQFNAIKKLSITSPHIRKARDLFLFQCYTGLAYSDLMSFSHKNCEEMDGKLFYHAKRTKTDTDFVFQILEPAKQILEKYNYELPSISNQKYNDYLKVIGGLVGVGNLHSHMGRATAATLFLSKGMPINIVARVLGHTTLRQTTRYARTLNKDVMGAFDKLEGKM